MADRSPGRQPGRRLAVTLEKQDAARFSTTAIFLHEAIPGHHFQGSLSREAGMYTAHDMMESLDPNHHSEIAESLMVECERLLDESLAG